MQEGKPEFSETKELKWALWTVRPSFSLPLRSGQTHTFRSFGFVGRVGGWFYGCYTLWFREFAKCGRACFLPHFPSGALSSLPNFSQLLHAEASVAWSQMGCALEFGFFGCLFQHRPVMCSCLVFIGICWDLAGRPVVQNQDRKIMGALYRAVPTSVKTTLSGSLVLDMVFNAWFGIRTRLLVYGRQHHLQTIVSEECTDVLWRYCEFGSRPQQ